MVKRVVVILVISFAVVAAYAGGSREAGPATPAGPVSMDPLGKYDPPITMTSVAAVDAMIKFNLG